MNNIVELHLNLIKILCKFVPFLNPNSYHAKISKIVNPDNKNAGISPQKMLSTFARPHFVWKLKIGENLGSGFLHIAASADQQGWPSNDRASIC